MAHVNDQKSGQDLPLTCLVDTTAKLLSFLLSLISPLKRIQFKKKKRGGEWKREKKRILEKFKTRYIFSVSNLFLKSLFDE